jgi:hypothetical protein
MNLNITHEDEIVLRQALIEFADRQLDSAAEKARIGDTQFSVDERLRTRKIAVSLVSELVLA